MVAVWAHGTSVVPFPTHLVEGWRWALTKRVFLSAIILGAIVNIACVGAQIMLAARGTSAVMIGLLGTAMGVSTLVGSLLANKRGASFKNEREIRSGASPVLSVNS